ncbi:MAG: glycine betaine ABC transporter substrate-binding protein [Coriobacteriia bacterium]|nr:glycine betaine ABC transporter substrate-binding protein [Coriobacteriia bacterium]
MRKPIALLLALVLALALGVTGCGGDADEDAGVEPKDGPEVRVTSLLDSEGAVLGSMIIQMLEADGIKTVDKTKLGTPDVVRQALLEGEVDIHVSYTGSGQYFHEGEEGDPVWSDPIAGYERIAELDKEAYGLWWLTPADANNTELIATTKAFAEANGLETMDDFTEYVNGGGEVKLIGAQAWMDSPVGLAGFEEAYGFEMAPGQLLGLSHGNTAEMLKALAEGTDGVNFSLTYGTDGQLDDLDLVVLTDTLSVPPVYAPTPVVRNEIMEAYPEIADILKPVFESLDLVALQQLNRRVSLGGEDAAAVAKEYLTSNGFLD